MQDFEKGVSDVQSRDVIEMMMITQYFDMLKVRAPPAIQAMPMSFVNRQAAAHALKPLVDIVQS